MRPIPQPLRDKLELQRRMKMCAVFALGYGFCEGRIEWDHVWIYAGRQINEEWAIVGVCNRHHRAKEGNILLKGSIQRASLRLATEGDLAQYPRTNWHQIKKSLGLIPTSI